MSKFYNVVELSVTMEGSASMKVVGRNLSYAVASKQAKQLNYEQDFYEVDSIKSFAVVPMDSDVSMKPEAKKKIDWAAIAHMN